VDSHALVAFIARKRLYLPNYLSNVNDSLFKNSAVQIFLDATSYLLASAGYSHSIGDIMPEK